MAEGKGPLAQLQPPAETKTYKYSVTFAGQTHYLTSRESFSDPYELFSKLNQKPSPILSIVDVRGNTIPITVFNSNYISAFGRFARTPALYEADDRFRDQVNGAIQIFSIAEIPKPKPASAAPAQKPVEKAGKASTYQYSVTFSVFTYRVTSTERISDPANLFDIVTKRPNSILSITDRRGNLVVNSEFARQYKANYGRRARQRQEEPDSGRMPSFRDMLSTTLPITILPITETPASDATTKPSVPAQKPLPTKIEPRHKKEPLHGGTTR